MSDEDDNGNEDDDDDGDGDDDEDDDGDDEDWDESSMMMMIREKDCYVDDAGTILMRTVSKRKIGMMMRTKRKRMMMQMS